MLCDVVREQVSEHLLQSRYQPALQLHLQAALFSLLLAAGGAGETQVFWLARHQPKELICNEKHTYLE